MKKIIFIIIGLSFVFIIGACLPDKNKIEAANNAVVRAELKSGGNQTTLYIPKKDFNKLSPHIEGNDSILLNVMYPDMTPILERPNDLWAKGEWYRNISILIHQYSKPITINEFLDHKIDSLKATKFVGEEFSLEHYSQQDGGVQDKYDVWVDKQNNEVQSFVTCSEMITETSVPQCSHYIRSSTLSIQFSYNKKLLKDNKKIKKQIYDLLESYQTPETAKEYFKIRLEKAKNSQGEK